MLKPSSGTAPLIICMSILLLPQVLCSQQPADTIHSKDTSIRSVPTAIIQTKKKKKKRDHTLKDSSAYHKAAKPPAYTPYNSPPVQPSNIPPKQTGATILRDIINSKRKN
jgi:hypothetical protein